MVGEKHISIELIRGTNNEYMIKDFTGITIGRFFILEMDEGNRNCSIRLKFYREEDNEALKETLKIILRTIYKNKHIYKVNMFVNENITPRPFVDLGFTLEGILEDNLYSSGNHMSEFIFGMTSIEYNSSNRVNVFSLKGPRITLKVLSPEHSKELLDYYLRNKEHLKSFEPLREESFYTLEVQRNILMENYKQYINGTSLNLGIYNEGIFIGKIQLSNIVQGIFKSAILGYSIDEEKQGKGYMKEAVNLVLEYAFEEMDLHRIEASTLLNNIKSQKVLRACGFKELGINERYLFINGGWKDHITFYKTR